MMTFLSLSLSCDTFNYFSTRLAVCDVCRLSVSICLACQIARTNMDVRSEAQSRTAARKEVKNQTVGNLDAPMSRSRRHASAYSASPHYLPGTFCRFSFRRIEYPEISRNIRQSGAFPYVLNCRYIFVNVQLYRML